MDRVDALHSALLAQPLLRSDAHGNPRAPYFDWPVYRADGRCRPAVCALDELCGWPTRLSTYRILFERSVNGLSVGSKVQYNGIEVGDVTELSLNPDDPRQVITLIRVYEDTPIKVDTRAKLAFASITGSMSVQLYGGTPESQRLLAQSSDDTPFIQADPSPIATLFDEGEEMVENLNAILQSVNELFDDNNREQAGNILTNIAQITEMIASQQSALDENMALFGDVSRQASTTLESIESLS